MANMVFYCDLESRFKSDFPVNGKSLESGESVEFTWRVRAPEKNLYRIQWEWELNRGCKLTVNGRSFAHHHDFFPKTYDDLELELECGINELECRLTNHGKERETVQCPLRILDPRGFPMPYDLDAYQPGIGAEIQSAGRFGFSKGDGVLDCSMPSFGILARPDVFGFPRYKSCHLWQVSLLPPGIGTRGEIEWQYECAEGEKIKADWTGVEWERRVQAECGYFSRKSGDPVTVRFSYSLLTPFILMETDDAAFHIAPEHYTKAVIWLENGVTVRESRNGLFYDRTRDGVLAATRVLFFHEGSPFPEIPLMVVLRESPEKITDSIDIVSDGDGMKWAMFAFPFGAEVSDRDSLNLSEMISRAEDLHPVALARPVGCREFFKRRGDRMDILQQFDFRTFMDSLETRPVKMAPLPAVLGIGTPDSPGAENLGFATKYGFLWGVRNSSWNHYTLPVPDYRNDYSLAPGTCRFNDFREFIHYHESRKVKKNPGAHSFLYHWTIPLRMFAQMEPEQRAELIAFLRPMLEKICDADSRYIGPDDREARMWYERTEPFTGVGYMFSYLHVCLNRFLSSFERDHVEHFRRPFMEFDWGNGLALYSMRDAARFSDSWDIIKRNWKLIRKIFDYFLVLQDWACMSAPLQENGHAFGDGAGFGAYPAFIQMAERIGRKDEFELGLYAYAKFMAFRRSLFRSGREYFPRFYGGEPWLCGKTFPEGLDVSAPFMGYPGPDIKGGYQHSSLYNLTTEGLYPEAFRVYAESMPEEVGRLLDTIENAYGEDLYRPVPEPRFHSASIAWMGSQEVMSYLILCIMTKHKPADELREMIEKAYRNNRILHEYLGIPIGLRRIPEEWSKAFLLSLLTGEELPRLADWNNLAVDDISFPHMKISGVRPGASLVFSNAERYIFKQNGKCLETIGEGKYIRVEVNESGMIKIESGKMIHDL